MKYHRVEERHFLIYERGLIWEGGTSRGALISVADNMLIMICGDGDFRVNLRKRHEVDPRWEFRVFERRRGEKYRGVPHAELKWIVNHRRTMSSLCLEPSWILEETQFCTFILRYFHILSRFNFYLHLPLFSYFFIFFLVCLVACYFSVLNVYA